MSIISFIKENIKFINEKIDNSESNDDLKFKLIYKKPSELLTFIFQGRGTYGNVFKVINNTKNGDQIPIDKSVILKIMKKPNKELERLSKISKFINSINNKYIINKYIMRVFNVDHSKNIAFLECIDGVNLKEYVSKNIIPTEEFNILLLRAVLCIKTIHNVLKYSHRDIKSPNIVYNPVSKVMKCIDYGFIVQLDDETQKQRYNGTGSHIHPDMNKKRSKIEKNSSIEYPDYIAQDLFATIIMILKLYNSNSKGNKTKNNRRYNNNTKKNKNNMNNNLHDILNNYTYSTRKEKKSDSRKIKDLIRYKSKKILINKLLEIDENKIDNVIIKELIILLKQNWNKKQDDFYVNENNNIIISNFIFDSLVFNIFKVIKNSDIKKELYNDWCLIYSHNSKLRI